MPTTRMVGRECRGNPRRKRGHMKKSKRVWVLIGSGSWGLWHGQIDADRRTRDEIVKSGVALVYGCRNIRYWYGPTGGITSLAAKGPDPADKRNRIGAPCDSLVTKIVNVYYCTPEAVARFAEIAP